MPTRDDGEFVLILRSGESRYRLREGFIILPYSSVNKRSRKKSLVIILFTCDIKCA